MKQLFSDSWALPVLGVSVHRIRLPAHLPRLRRNHLQSASIRGERIFPKNVTQASYHLIIWLYRFFQTDDDYVTVHHINNLNYIKEQEKRFIEHQRQMEVRILNHTQKKRRCTRLSGRRFTSFESTKQWWQKAKRYATILKIQRKARKRVEEHKNEINSILFMPYFHIIAFGTWRTLFFWSK